MFCSRYKEQTFLILKKYIWILLLIGIVSFSISVLQENNRTIFVQKISIIFLLLYFVKEHSSELNIRIKQTLESLALYSFGIYFIHDYFDLMYKFLLQSFTNETQFRGSITLFIFLFLLITSFSILTLNVLKKILGSKSREFIGC